MQFRQRVVIRDMSAGKDMADTSPASQADIPYPATGLRGRPGGGGDRGVFALIRQLHRPGAVCEQDVLAGQEGYLVVAVQNEAGQPAAIDEQVACNRLAADDPGGGQIAVFGRVETLDPPGKIGYAQRFAAMAPEQN